MNIENEEQSLFDEIEKVLLAEDSGAPVKLMEGSLFSAEDGQYAIFDQFAMPVVSRHPGRDDVTLELYLNEKGQPLGAIRRDDFDASTALYLADDGKRKRAMFVTSDVLFKEMLDS
jgi:hypothetical protein